MTKKLKLLLFLGGTIAAATTVVATNAAGKHYWKCYESGCSKAQWNGPYGSRDAANATAKEHERATKGHRWDLKEE